MTRSDANNSKGFDLVDLSNMEESFFENYISPKFLKYNVTQLFDITLGTFKSQIKNTRIHQKSNRPKSNQIDV